MTFKDIVLGVVGFFDSIVVPLLVSALFLVFLWGVVQYFFLKQNDPSARAEGVQFMLWGVIALAVVISMWGLVRLTMGVFGI